MSKELQFVEINSFYVDILTVQTIFSCTFTRSPSINMAKPINYMILMWMWVTLIMLKIGANLTVHKNYNTNIITSTTHKYIKHMNKYMIHILIQNDIFIYIVYVYINYTVIHIILLTSQWRGKGRCMKFPVNCFRSKGFI